MRATEFFPDHMNEGNFNGVTVRKGSVGAFIANARLIADPTSTPAAKEIALRDIEEAIPALEAVGLFEILEVRDSRLRSFIEQRLEKPA